jgi:hypothetical protein
VINGAGRQARRGGVARFSLRALLVLFALFAFFLRRLGQLVEQRLDPALGLDQALLEREVLGAEQGIGLTQQIILGAQRLGQLGQPVDFV